MQRTRKWLWLGVAFGLLTLPVAIAPAARLSESVLPKTTVGFLAISNYDALNQHWKKTQLGQLMDDPVMAPFRKDLRGQMQHRWANVHERLGLTLEDMESVAGGEVGVALIEPKPGEAAMAIIADVSGHLPQAQELLKKSTASLLKQGAKQSREVVGGVDINVFDLPEEELPKALDGKAAAPAAASEPNRTVYALVDSLLIAADNLDEVRGILTRLAAGNAQGSLAEVPGFQAVMKRAAADAGEVKEHQIRWFIYPLGYAEARRAATPVAKRRRGQTVVGVIRHQGFSAIQGVGGLVDFAPDGYELLHRTAIYAPRPYQKSMKMLVLPNGSNYTPQDWVPRDIASYTSFYVDILNAFDNFGPLFDELFGEGETGVWDQVLDGLKTQPDGPKIDLREDLIKHLGKRVTAITDNELPITTTSERLLFAIETTDEKAVALGVEKSMKNDPTVKRRVIDGHVIWEIVEEAQGEELKVPSISLGEAPSLTPKKGTAPGTEEKDAGDKEVHFLPHGAVTVAYGHLFVASHIDFLLKILKPLAKEDRLAESPEYKQVAATIEKQGLKAHCAEEFARTDEQLRPTYELIRQGKMPESESLLGRALNTFSGAAKKGVMRPQRINGKNLPDYQVVRRSLGLGGMGAVSEPDGWFLKGFLLPK